MNGIHEVDGSIPSGSTTKRDEPRATGVFSWRTDGGTKADRLGARAARAATKTTPGADPA